MSRRFLLSAIVPSLALPVLALGLSGNAAAAARMTAGAAATRAARPPAAVVLNCRGTAKVRPRGFTLACADGNNVLTRLSWTSWTRATATATGTQRFNQCVPDCASDTFRSYPVRVILWGQAGRGTTTRYTTITLLYPGARPWLYDGWRWEPMPDAVTAALWS